MEYLPFGDLHHYLESPLPESETQQVIFQVLEGLSFMHQNDFAHRDLKPSNILVKERGPEWWVKLSDFGISKRAEDSTALQSLVGTHGYLAPEVLGLLEVDGGKSEGYLVAVDIWAVDIWAVGINSFQLLTGELPFPGPCFRSLKRFVEDKQDLPEGPLLARTVNDESRKFVREVLAPLAETVRMHEKLSARTSYSRYTPILHGRVWIKPHSNAEWVPMLDKPSARWTNLDRSTIRDEISAHIADLTTRGASNNSATHPITATTIKRAIVQYNYERAEDNEIDLHKGEYITNINMVHKDWWIGTNARGESGLFPSNYVGLVADGQIIYVTPPTAPKISQIALTNVTATGQYGHERAEDNDMSVPEDAKITDIEFSDENRQFGHYDVSISGELRENIRVLGFPHVPHPEANWHLIKRNAASSQSKPLSLQSRHVYGVAAGSNNRGMDDRIPQASGDGKQHREASASRTGQDKRSHQDVVKNMNASRLVVHPTREENFKSLKPKSALLYELWSPIITTMPISRIRSTIIEVLNAMCLNYTEVKGGFDVSEHYKVSGELVYFASTIEIMEMTFHKKHAVEFARIPFAKERFESAYIHETYIYETDRMWEIKACLKEQINPWEAQAKIKK